MPLVDVALKNGYASSLLSNSGIVVGSRLLLLPRPRNKEKGQSPKWYSGRSPQGPGTVNWIRSPGPARMA